MALTCVVFRSRTSIGENPRPLASAPSRRFVWRWDFRLDSDFRPTLYWIIEFVRREESNPPLEPLDLD